MTDNADLKLINVETAAEILGMDARALYRYVRGEFFPPGIIVHIGRLVRFEYSALQEWIRQGGQKLDEEDCDDPDESFVEFDFTDDESACVDKLIKKYQDKGSLSEKETAQLNEIFARHD